jgi:pyrimidine operon attenuation protein/uracil phosphoribosyltransferase
MTDSRTRILDADQVRQKIRRMAYQMYEENFKEKAIVLAGVDGQGYVLAGLIALEYQRIAETDVKVVRVSMDKVTPEKHPVTLDCSMQALKKKSIVLVDDVLNTGRTLAYALKPFLDTDVKKLEIAVLVNRSHSKFPVFPRYSGLELATTLNDHVEVILGKEPAVYLL